MEILWAR